MSIEDLMNGTNCNYVGYDSVDTVDKNTKAIEELRQNVNTLNNEVDALSISVTTGDLQADMISATHVDTGTVLANSVDTDVINAKEINLVRDNFIEATNADVGIVSIPENQSIKFYLISDTQSVQVSYTDGSLNVQAKTGNLEKIDVYKEAGRVYFATFINDTERFYYWTELAEDVQPVVDLAYLGYTLEYSAVIENNGTYFAGEVFGYRNSFGELEANVLTNSEYIYGRDFIDLPETLDPGTEENNVYIKIPKFVGQVKLFAKNLANDELFSMTFNRELSDSDGDVASTLSYTTKDMSYIKDVFSDLEGNLYVATRAFGKLWFSTNTFENMDVITADQGVSPYIPLDDRLISYQPTLPARHVILGDGTLASGLDIQGELAADIIKLPEGISYENLAVSGTLNAGTVLVENEIEVPSPVADSNPATKLYVDTVDEELRADISAVDINLTNKIDVTDTELSADIAAVDGRVTAVNSSLTTQINDNSAEITSLDGRVTALEDKPSVVPNIETFSTTEQFGLTLTKTTTMEQIAIAAPNNSLSKIPISSSLASAPFLVGIKNALAITTDSIGILTLEKIDENDVVITFAPNLTDLDQVVLYESRFSAEYSSKWSGWYAPRDVPLLPVPGLERTTAGTQDWIIPVTGEYEITIESGQGGTGGAGTYTSSISTSYGGGGGGTGSSGLVYIPSNSLTGELVITQVGGAGGGGAAGGVGGQGGASADANSLSGLVSGSARVPTTNTAGGKGDIRTERVTLPKGTKISVAVGTSSVNANLRTAGQSGGVLTSSQYSITLGTAAESAIAGAPGGGSSIFSSGSRTATFSSNLRLGGKGGDGFTQGSPGNGYGIAGYNVTGNTSLFDPAITLSYNSSSTYDCRTVAVVPTGGSSTLGVEPARITITRLG